jgi:hydrogenase maturation factor
VDALSAGAVNDVGASDVGVSEDLAAAALALARHPGLLEPGPEAACTEEVCITCSDEGQVAEVTAVYEDGRAEVLARGRRETVDVSLVDAGPGDLVLVHAGVALSLLELPAMTVAPGGAATTAT